MSKCRLCGHEESAGYDGPAASVTLEMCTSCHLIWLSLPTEATDYVASMEEEFFANEYLVSRDWVLRRLAKRRAGQRLRQIAHFKRHGEMLEIGPGGGELLEAATRRGFKCRALDLSQSVVRQINSLDVAAEVGSFRDAPKLGRQFDVVVMSHVLEHCEDPVEALLCIRATVRDGGIIYIAVPNVASWPAHLSGWKSYLPYHLYYFTPETLSATVRAAGFSVRQLTTFQDVAGWPVAVARTLLPKTRLGRRSSIPLEGRGKRRGSLLAAWNGMTAVVGYALTPLRAVQGWLMRGDELVVIGERRVG